MSDYRVGRNNPCPCRSGLKFKNCCIGRASVLPSPPPRPPARNHLAPDLKVRAFVPGNREWRDAVLKDIQPGQEFVLENQLYLRMSPSVIRANNRIDALRLSDADRPFDPQDWRLPVSEDVVYAFDGNGQPVGHCLLGSLSTGQKCAFQGLMYRIEPGPTPDTFTVAGPLGKDHRPDRRLFVWLSYTITSEFGIAEVGFRYTAGELIPLANGGAVPVEHLTPGMKFVLEDGGTATVTKVGVPKQWEPNDEHHDAYGNGYRRVVGTYKFTGWVPLMTVTVGGEVHEVTPAHAYWSETRRGWFPIHTFRVGELVKALDGQPIPIESMTPPKFVHTTVYNFEVDEFHTYFVGRGTTAVWVHNGMGDGCGVPKAADVRKTLSSRLPQEGVNGTWNGTTPGNGIWRSTDLRVRQAVAKPGEIIPTHVDVQFRNGRPVFDGHIKSVFGIKGETQITLDVDAKASLRTRSDRDFSAANEWLAGKLNEAGVLHSDGGRWSVTKVKQHLADNNWQWHHHEDMTTMQLLDRSLHDPIPHIGGRSLKDFTFDPPLPTRKPK